MTTPPTIEQIIREHDAMFRRIASSYEADRHLAEELVQDMYFAIWQALPGFRAASSLRTFVARIATNRAITHVARAVRSPLEGLTPGEISEVLGITANAVAIRLSRGKALLREQMGDKP